MIYIIRHGQTDMNNRKVLQGRGNHPLNQKGVEQAAEAGEWFLKQEIKFNRIYSSPLIRAMQTAAIVSGLWTGHNLPETFTDAYECMILDKRLIEMDYGPYEGINMTDPPPEMLTFFRDFQNNPSPEGVESLAEIVNRTGDFMEEIKETAAEETILISTHAIAMKGLLEYLTPESQGAYWSKYVGNCAVYTTGIFNGGYTVPRELSLL